MATPISTTSLKTKPTLTNIYQRHNTTSLNSEHFSNEQYPKTCFEQIPLIILEYPSSKQNNHLKRSHHSHRFRTQPVTLTEICEIDEENNIENNNQQQKLQTKLINNDNQFEQLTLAENIRRMARKKVPLKNFLQRQQLKTTGDVLYETDGN